MKRLRTVHYKLTQFHLDQYEYGVILPRPACGARYMDTLDYTQDPEQVTCVPCKNHPDVAARWSTIESRISDQFEVDKDPE